MNSAAVFAGTEGCTTSTFGTRATQATGATTMARHFALDYMEEQSAAGADYAWRLFLIGYLTPIVVTTVGYALFQTANNTAVMADIRADQRGVISGMLNLSRNLGLITGASVMGSLYALGSDATAGLRLSFAVATLLVGVLLVLRVCAAGYPPCAEVVYLNLAAPGRCAGTRHNDVALGDCIDLTICAFKGCGDQHATLERFGVPH